MLLLKLLLKAVTTVLTAIAVADIPVAVVFKSAAAVTAVTSLMLLGKML